MQCYTELTPPTAVTHSLCLPFINAQSNNLVVARASLLQIFTTKPVSAELDKAQNAQLQSFRSAEHYDSRINDDEGLEASFLGGDSVLVRSDRSNYTKLVLVAEFPLAGTITGLARIKSKTTASGGEALLLALKDAKLSMVEWDPEKNSINTTSIHYYEQEDLQAAPWAAPLSHYVNFLAADPGSRCAALKFGSRSLAIVQFKTVEEDIDMDDWDEELDGPKPVKEQSTTLANGTSSNEETPYSTSFVLRLPNLDPSLIHPVHLAFLHEYREPTFGILSSTTSPSLVLGRRDQLTYMVFTLDLQQKASTTILSVTGLPQDLFRVIALPAPVGGALLVGTNELIHIDQSGKSHGVGVNQFAKQTTSFSLVDQAELELKLEGCEVEVLSAESGEFLMVLRDGRLAVIMFRVDGRIVSGLSLRLIASEAGGSIIPTGVATLSKLNKACIFAGSEGADSLVIGWTRKQGQSGKRKARLQDPSLDDIDMDDEDMEGLEDEDDLYGEDYAPAKQSSNSTSTSGGKTGELVFRVHDRLVSIAAIRDFAIGQAIPSTKEDQANQIGVTSDLSFVCACGEGNAGSIAVINREIQPKVIGHFEFPEARGFWTMAAQKPIPKALQGDKGATSIGGEYETSAQYDRYMIVPKVDLDGYETSDVYALTGAGFEALTGTEFEPAAGLTIEAGTMGNHMRIIQVLKTAVHCYDGDFGLTQILPMLDEETGAEPRVDSASIADPFLLLVRDDASVFIAKIFKNLELEELEKEDSVLTSTKWATGCLYEDRSGIFAGAHSDEGAKTDENIVMFLLSKAGALHVYALPELSKPVYVAEGLPFVPPLLSANYAARRGTAKETIKEILVADLGDMTSSYPYLIVRHDNDDVTIYQPFRIPSTNTQELSTTLQFQKLPNPVLADDPEPPADDEDDEIKRPTLMRRCDNIAGYKTVFLPGDSPSFILRSSKTLPKVLRLQGGGVRGMSSFHTEGCERGFIYADSKGIARVSQIPIRNTTYADIGMSLKKIPLNSDIHSITHHPPSGTYVVGCDTREPFELPKEDDYHKEWQHEKDLPLKPTVGHGSIKLINPSTWTVIDNIELEPCEIVMCIETLNLEVSESTNERKHLITVGTAVSRGEDLPIRGRVLVYDIVTVIPEPGKPETDKKLKLVANEEIPRGAVTALSEIGTQGLMLVAQGQKCMVRGLKEDGTLLPVAFMDMSCYVTTVRELKGTGLCLMADAVKGVWFTGYTEEPYRMVLFGKSSTKLEILTVDFLPDGDELFIVACDSDGGIHILQFDPDHPKSLQGHLLLHRTTFSAGAHPPTRSMLLPRTLPADSEYLSQHINNATANASSDPDSHPAPPSLILFSSPTGALSCLAALSEPQYRRLSFLTGQVLSSLPHHAGLNPKDYRAPASSGAVGRFPPAVDAGMGRSIVDGALLARWNELGAGRRAEIAGRVGFAGVDEVRDTLREVLGAAGLGYL
ncbi:CPSF A subunit region-domain-containing protein [Annulohypoxylon truncatum]|uniref:CPSF A subunit region-domain-containing protein n=1 Tax=Annulohypoxylon truncatum TaxID=327061 RepID=UPI002007F420|nr:CPSF A subunit region-domain-containing protein [Annulohypoxylon truncatum]KAI1209162.1 CPSF A subunit region-domain-containing protein [Annulohypoxylon truncatum]